MKNLLQRLINAGVEPDTALWFQFRVRLINQFSICCLIVASPWYIIFTIKQQFDAMLVVLGGHILFALAIYFNYHKKYVSAKLSSVFASNLSVLCITYILGYQSGFFLYYYTPPFFVYWLFDIKKEKHLIFLTGLLYIACMTCVLTLKDYFPGAHMPEIIFLGMSIFSWNLILSILLLFYMFYVYTTFYSELTESLHLKQKYLSQEIEKRTRSETRTSQLFKDLTVSYKSLEQFSFIVSHNIRSPFARIKGLSMLFKKENNENDVLIDNIQKSVQQLETVLNDLNYLLNLKQEVLENKEEIKLSDAVEYCRKSLSAEIEKTDAQISEEFDADIHVKAIKSIFHSILLNIIQNAIKYKKENYRPEINIRAYIDQDQLIIQLRDNGLGINTDLYGDKMFRLYSRFHLDIEGKGIGLFLVKTQLDLIGGTINVYSLPNEGCTFTLYLPIDIEAAETVVQYSNNLDEVPD